MKEKRWPAINRPVISFTSSQINRPIAVLFTPSAYTSFDELFDTWKKQPQILETAGSFEDFAHFTPHLLRLVKNLSDKARFLGTGSDSAQSRAALYV